MATEKHVILFQRLLNKTKEGHIEWKETVNTEAFMAAFKDYSVIIKPVQSERGTDLLLEIWNEAGEVVDSVDDVEMSEFTSAGIGYIAFNNLYELARRNARGADVAINSILEQLDDDLPF